MRGLTAFARNDFRGVLREPLLIGVLVAPVIWTLMVRLPLPAASDLLADRYGIDLVPYHALILTGFLVLTAPVITGGLMGLMVLDERDAGTLLALRVTPVPMGGYVSYRAGFVVVLTASYVVATTFGSGLLPARLIPATAAVGVLAGACGLVIGLTLLAFAGNKVEGLAVLRGLGILVAGLPLVPYFLSAEWQWLFWVIPTYWPAKAFWAAFDGGSWWLHLVIGLAYQAVLVAPLYWRFRRGLA